MTQNLTSKPKVCIAAKLPRDRAETFIAQHMNGLPYPTRVVYGNPPHTDELDGYLFQKNLREKISGRIQSLFRDISEQSIQTQMFSAWLQREQISVVIAEYGDIATTVIDACLDANVPLIAHFHGHDAYEKNLLERQQSGYKKLFDKAAAIVGVSHEMVEQLISIGAPPERTHYISYFVDADKFSGGDPENAPPHFVGIGRFVETKAPYLTLAAFARVHEAYPEVRLTIAGDGPLRGPCLDLAEYFGIADAVNLPGNVDHGQVAEFMRTARAFVQHSIRCRDNTREGTPNAVLEAQASGLPVIATRHAGIVDAVADGESGFLVDERDVLAMADRMLTLARNPSLAASMGLNGRSRITEQYSREKTLLRLAQLVERVQCTQSETALTR